MGLSRWRMPKAPFLVSIAVLSAAIALFATVYLLADLLVLRPILIPELSGVVRMGGLSTPQLHDRVGWWSQTSALNWIAHMDDGTVEVQKGDERHLRKAALVSRRFFDILAVQPVTGRFFDDRDFDSDEIPTAVVSARLAQDVFGDSGSAVGFAIRVSGLDHVIVGVAPSATAFPLRTDLWIPERGPATARPAFVEGRNDDWIGRLAPQRTAAQAHQELMALLTRLQEEEGKITGVRYGTVITVRSLADAVARPYKGAVLALLAGAGMLLLLAVGNVATLLTAHAIDRRATFGIQVALGATPRHLRRTLVSEALQFGVIAGLAGGLAANWVARAIAPIVNEHVVTFRSFEVAGATGVACVAGGALGGALLACLASVPPLLVFSTWSDWRVLTGRAELSESRRARRTRSVLAIVQLAAAMALVVAAGLSLRTFAQFSDIKLGFAPAQVMRLKALIPPGLEDTAADHLRVVRHEPVARASNVPLADPSLYQYISRPPGGASASHFSVSDHYFRVMRIRTLQGRTFVRGDRSVVVVSESTARQLFPSGGAVGSPIKIGGETWDRTIIGVVDDVTERRLAEAAPRQFYLPIDDTYMGGTFDAPVTTMLLSCGGPCPPRAQVRGAIEAAHGQVLAYDRLDAAFAEVLAPTRLRAGAAVFYGAAGSILAFGGMYSLMSFLVAASRKEIAIRLASGASPLQALRLLLGRSLRVAFWGIGLGALSAYPLLRIVRYLFAGFAAWDTGTYLAAASLLALGAMVAAAGPALAVFRVDVRRELDRSTY